MKSMQSNIISFFFLSILVVMSFIFAYITYTYYAELEKNAKGSLELILSDIKRAQLSKTLDEENLQNFLKELQGNRLGEFLTDLKLEIVDSVPSDKRDDIFVTTNLAKGKILYLSSSLTRLHQEVIHFTLRNLAFFAVVILIFGAVFIIFVKGQFKSLHCLVEFCNSYRNDHTLEPVCDGTYEVKSMRNAILSLIDTNDYLCDQRQELFKEAAHELKSPIAVLKARISLFEHDDTMDKKSFVLDSQEDIAHITSKLKELIFLKSIEWDMQLPREDVNMEDNCKMMQDAFEPILRKKSVMVDSNWKESFVIHTYKEAMQKVLQAVFENIFIHTKANSTILVEAKPNEIFIKNAIGGDDDIPLFSSYIGMKMIERLAPKLAYEYKTSSDEKYFYTQLIFHSMDVNGCAI